MDCFSKTPSLTIACCSSDISSTDGPAEPYSPATTNCFSTGQKVQFSIESPNAVLPSKGTRHSAGFDFHSAEEGTILPWGKRVFDTDIRVRGMPDSSFLKLESRSGLCANDGLIVGAGIIDPDFKSTVKVVLFNLNPTPYKVKKHQKICQGIFVKTLDSKKIQQVSCNREERGARGFGSTD
jgi:dUTP pyrophosphatase